MNYDCISTKNTSSAIENNVVRNKTKKYIIRSEWLLVKYTISTFANKEEQFLTVTDCY